MRICVVGATGWTGQPLCAAIERAEDLELACGVARRAAGETLPGGSPIYGDVGSALAAGGIDVLVDYTAPGVAAGHVEQALEQGAHVVLGTTGVTEPDVARLGALATQRGLGLIVCANFSVLYALLCRAALEVVRHVDHWELIEYNAAAKPDAPGGASSELANRLAAVKTPIVDDLSEMIGDARARGASVAGTQVHSLRLPGYIATLDVLLAAVGDRLVIRYEPAGGSEPYVDGTLVAVRNVAATPGLTRGIDRFLFGED